METRTSTRRQRWVAMAASVALVYAVFSPSMDNFDAMLTGTVGNRSLQVPPLEPKPNMLLFVLDQWRYDWDGMTGDTPTGANPLNMPFLKEAAKKGVRFTQAYVPSPLCAPVRACLASGKEYDECGVILNRADSWPVEQDTFYKLMRDQQDFQIFSCGKDDLYHNDVNFPFFPNLGSEGAIDLGFTNAMRSAGKHKVTREGEDVNRWDRYRTFLNDARVGNGTKEVAYDVYKDCFDGLVDGTKGNLCTADKFTSKIYPDDFVANEAIQLLEKREPKKPWYMQVNFPGPHAPEVRQRRNCRKILLRRY